MKRIVLFIAIIKFIAGCEEKDSPGENKFQFSVADSIYKAGDNYFYKNDFNSAIKIYHKSLMSLPVNDSVSKLRSHITNDIGLCYKKIGNYDSALKYYSMAASYDLNRNDSISVIGRWLNIGNLYKNSGRYIEAVYVLNNSLDYAKNKNQSRFISMILNSLGGIMLKQSRYSEAIDYYRIGLKHFDLAEDTLRYSVFLHNLGEAFYLAKKYDSATHYTKKTIEYRKERDSLNLSTSLHNMGLILKEVGEIDSSMIYLRKSLQIKRKFQDRRGIALTSNALANCLIEKEKLDDAIQFLNLAYDYGRDQQIQDIIVESLFLYSKYYNSAQDYKKSLRYYGRWVSLKDSLFNQEIIKSIDLQYAHNLSGLEKEKRIAEQEAELNELRASQILILAIVLIGFLILALSFLFITSAQQKKLKSLSKDLKIRNEKIEKLNRQNFHFTKNSLAGLVAILNRQIRKVRNEDIKSILIDEKLRMETINLLYNQLFTNQSKRTIDAKPFVESIILNTLEGMKYEDQVRKNLDIEQIHFDNDVAFNLGMILNEAIINACKYAFKIDGILLVRLLEKNRHISLEIADNGPGFPNDFDWKTSDSFGISLIRLLSEDLEAQTEIESSKKGLKYTIELNIDDE